MSQTPVIPAPAAGSLAARKCGRCQQMFEGDASLPTLSIADWWVCDNCRHVLLPNRGANTAPGARRSHQT